MHLPARHLVFLVISPILRGGDGTSQLDVTAQHEGIKTSPQPDHCCSIVFFSLFLSSLFAMSQLRTLLLLFAAVSGVSASIGPGATLPIVNTNISPDGFTRA